MKKRFHVKKRTLLLIAGIVWLIAGFNVARLGILSYRVIDRKWYLYLFSVVVFFLFGMMFYKSSGSWYASFLRITGVQMMEI